MADMPEPRWRDDDRAWKNNILSFMDMAAHMRSSARADEQPVSDRARAVAVAVFYTAANHNTVFRAPLPTQIHAWAQTFDCDESGCREWLTVDLATRAVDAHFSESTDGRMLPAHVLRKAAVLKLEEGVDS
ncbi:hypothetical protein AAI421_14560 [Rhodococcus aetherivorans]|uniref:hypothetical protein n=1 Tax=Rhodococcus aetherivorans TaxID=191292 RepID=UPI0031D5A64A